MAGSFEKHEYIAWAIYQRPELIGLPTTNLAGKTRDENLIINRAPYVTPDIRFNYLAGECQARFVEVKSSNSNKSRERGLSQIEKTLTWADMNRLNIEAWLVYPTWEPLNYQPGVLYTLAIEKYHTPQPIKRKEPVSLYQG